MDFVISRLNFIGEGWNNNDATRNSLKRNGAFSEPNATMEVAQLLLSLLHAWGMDPDLDRVCEGKLGLLRPMVPVSFGVLSKGGGYKKQLKRFVFHEVKNRSCKKSP